MAQKKSWEGKPKIVGVVPAKGFSSRVPGKNARLLNGTSLARRAYNKLRRVPLIDEVYLDTDCPKVRASVDTPDNYVLKRTAGLDTADGNQLLLNTAARVEADVYVQHLGTSPFITPRTIEECIAAVVDDEYDGALTVHGRGHLYWVTDETVMEDKWLPAYDTKKLPNSDDLSPAVHETTGLYVITREALLRNKSRIAADNTKLVHVLAIEAIDIDEFEDWDLAYCVAVGLEHP